MKIIIIGNGISGITAARQLRKLDEQIEIVVISAETDYFFSRTALMYIYMGHMRFEDTKPYEDWFWDKNRIQLKKAYVAQVDVKNKQLKLSGGESLAYDKLIIATGSKPNKFGWPGENLKAVQGLYSYQDLQTMEKYSDQALKRAVIVGGGLIGIEMAEMFHARNIPVTFLVREQSYWDAVLPPEESQMVNRHILEHHIDLRLKTSLKEILGDENGRVKAIITEQGEEIPCQFVGLTTGVQPNIDFLKESGIEYERGVLVDDYLQTNIEGIYAIGDCAQIRTPQTGRRPIEAIWYTGRIMGETVAYNILYKNAKTYRPGLWFNSAKFFDIEYQVYGEVPSQLTESMETIYWEHPKGKKSIRINYDKDTQAVKGFNLMGIRYRHEVCKKWIQERTPIRTVLEHLGMANFDPEFYDEYEAKVIEKYNQNASAPIQLKKRRGLSAVLRFLKGNRTL